MGNYTNSDEVFEHGHNKRIMYAYTILGLFAIRHFKDDENPLSNVNKHRTFVKPCEVKSTD